VLLARNAYAREDAAYAHDALSCLACEVQAPRRFVQLSVVVGGAAGTRGRDPGSLAGAQAEQRLLEAELAGGEAIVGAHLHCRGPAYRSRP
jgi:hypothetical protein